MKLFTRHLNIPKKKQLYSTVYITRQNGKHCGGEHEQAIHYTTELLHSKGLPVKYQITAQRPWHIANKVSHSTVCKSVETLRDNFHGCRQ